MAGYLVLALLFQIAQCSQAEQDYFTLTVWPLGGSQWKYPVCRDPFHIDYDVRYISITQSNRPTDCTNCAPCHCHIHPTHSTDIKDVRVNFRNNFHDPEEQRYGYGDWNQTDPKGWFRFSLLQASQAYTKVQLYLNDHNTIYSLNGDNRIQVTLDGGSITLSCTNDNFTTSTLNVFSTTATPKLNLYTKKLPLPDKRPPQSNVTDSKSLTTVSAKPTSNSSWFLGSSTEDEWTDLPLILGLIGASVSLFLLLLLLVMLYLTKQRKVKYNCAQEERKKQNGSAATATLKSVRYKRCPKTICRRDEQVLELSYIYTDDDNYLTSSKWKSADTADSKFLKENSVVIENQRNECLMNGMTHDGCHGTCHQVMNGMTHEGCNGICHQVVNGMTHDGCHNTCHQVMNESEVVPLKVEPVHNQPVKNTSNHLHQIAEVKGTDTNDGQSPSQQLPAGDNPYDPSLMVQFLEEFNRKLPLEEADSTQDLNSHNRSILPHQNTFQASTFKGSPYLNGIPEEDEINLPPPDQTMMNNGCHCPGHTYANMGQNANYNVLDNGSHYAQIDLTSLVKTEKPAKRWGDDHQIVYAELDLKRT